MKNLDEAVLILCIFALIVLTLNGENGKDLLDLIIDGYNHD